MSNDNKNSEQKNAGQEKQTPVTSTQNQSQQVGDKKNRDQADQSDIAKKDIKPEGSEVKKV